MTTREKLPLAAHLCNLSALVHAKGQLKTRGRQDSDRANRVGRAICANNKLGTARRHARGAASQRVGRRKGGGGGRE